MGIQDNLFCWWPIAGYPKGLTVDIKALGGAINVNSEKVGQWRVGKLLVGNRYLETDENCAELSLIASETITNLQTLYHFNIPNKSIIAGQKWKEENFQET